MEDKNEKKPNHEFLNHIRTFAKNIDETIQTKINQNNGFFQSIDAFFDKLHLKSDIQLDWAETEKHYLLKAKMPGVSKEDIELSLQGNQLIIAYLKKIEVPEDTSDNSSVKTYSKTFHFHHPIDEKTILATYKNGLLSIKVQKANKKQIAIH